MVDIFLKRSNISDNVYYLSIWQNGFRSWTTESVKNHKYRQIMHKTHSIFPNLSSSFTLMSDGKSTTTQPHHKISTPTTLTSVDIDMYFSEYIL